MIRAFQISFLVLFLISCDSTKVYQDFKDLEGTWILQDTVFFDVDIEDIDMNYKVDVHVSNSSSYEYYNLYFKFFIEDPSSELLTDDLKEVILFEPKTGKPLGSGVGNSVTVSANILEDFQPQVAGQYKFGLIQYMRVDTLQDIDRIGIKVSKIID